MVLFFSSLRFFVLLAALAVSFNFQKDTQVQTESLGFLEFGIKDTNRSVLKNARTQSVVRFVKPLQKSDIDSAQLNDDVVVTPFVAKDSAYFQSTYTIDYPAGFEFSKLGVVAKVEPVGVASFFGVQPSGSDFLTKDTFSDHQWALALQSQTITRDVDNTISKTLENSPASDLGWSVEVIKKIEATMKRDVSVAVIDTGLAISHEDFSDQTFFKNQAECESNGKPPIGDAPDRDGNGFEGDCLGWNFMDSSPKTARNVTDANGHGTFITGLLAADRDNSTGIAGLSKRIRVLPIQVYGSGQARDNGDTQIERAKPLTDRVARAILYSADRGVDVITLSLGWPYSIDSEYIRNAFQYALDKKVVIVAASGNNDMKYPLFPCSYKGVICVGSNSADKKISEFSNYGGHVDFVAPGDNVLSAFPFNEQQLNFGTKGYEIKSGTSFSAPYIAGVAALLKGINPSWNTADVKKALVGMSEDVLPNHRWVQFGIPRLPAMGRQTDLVAPEFKEKAYAPINSSLRSEFNISLDNFAQISGVKVAVKSQSPGVKVVSSDYTTVGKRNESFLVRLQAQSQDTDYEVNLEFTVKSNRGARTYKHSMQLVQDLNSENLKAKVDLRGHSDWVSSIPQLPSATVSGQVYTEKILEDEKGILFTKFDTDSGHVSALEILGKKVNPQGIFQLDLNYDGQQDILLVASVTVEKETEIRFYYLNQNLEPLFSGTPYFRQVYESAFIDPNQYLQMNWVRQSSEDLGALAVPVFFYDGRVPTADVDPDFVDRPDPSERARRLYYFEPVKAEGRWVFRTRIFDNYHYKDITKEGFGLGLSSESRLEFLFPQDHLEMQTGRVTVLMSLGKRDLRRYFVATLSESEIQSRKLDWKEWNSQSELAHLKLVRGVWNLEAGELGYNQNVGLFSNVTGSVASVAVADKSETGVSRQSTIRLSDLSDRFTSLVKLYQDSSQALTVYEAANNINLHSVQNQGVTDDSEMVERSTFLPGLIFSEVLFASVELKDRSWIPVIYVDKTFFSGRQIVIRELVDGKISTPIRNAFLVPENCATLDPVIREGKLKPLLRCKVGNRLGVYQLMR